MSVVTSAWMSVLKSPFLATDLLDDLDAAFAGEHLGVDDVDVLSEARFQQAGGERGGDQLGAAAGDLAAIGELGPLNRPLRHLGVQQAEPAGHIDVQPHFLQLRPIDGGHVDGKLHGPFRQIIDQQLGRFQGDRFLRLHRRRPQVRRRRRRSAASAADDRPAAAPARRRRARPRRDGPIATPPPAPPR